MMKCANYCTVTFDTYLHLALVHSLHILYSLTEWGNTEMAAPSAISFPGYTTKIINELLATYRRKSVFRTRVMLLWCH